MADTTAPAGDRRRLAVVIAAGLSAIALLVWMTTGQTKAGFTDTVTNEGNVFGTGSITITGDPANGSVLLTASDLLPGDSVTESITVTNGAEAPLKLNIFATGLTETPGTSGIAENLNVTITKNGAGTPFFEGTLAELAADHTDWASGTSGDEANGGDALAKASVVDGTDAVTYVFTVELDEGAGMPSRGVDEGDEAVVSIVFEGRA